MELGIGKIPFVPAISSVLRLRTNIAPTPGSNVPVNIYALSTPISVLFIWLSVRTVAESKSGGCSFIVLPEFDGRGGGPPS
jgi:hypothetical protein